jgi:hypothetical protein
MPAASPNLNPLENKETLQMKQWKYLLVGAAALTFAAGSSFADDVDQVGVPAASAQRLF